MADDDRWSSDMGTGLSMGNELRSKLSMALNPEVVDCHASSFPCKNPFNIFQDWLFCSGGVFEYAAFQQSTCILEMIQSIIQAEFLRGCWIQTKRLARSNSVSRCRGRISWLLPASVDSATCGCRG